MALSKITNASVADTAVHGRRNLIINGAMQISQRGTDINDIASDSTYIADRFRTRDYGGAGQYNYDQVTDVVPADFKYATKLEVDTAASDVGTYGYALEHHIEGYNISQLNLGTSNAKSFTISFWARSSLAGTYSSGVRTTSAEYSYHTEFTLAANTWKYITYTVPPLTSSLSSLDTTNGTGLIVDIVGFAKQTSKVVSNLDTWESGNSIWSTNQTDWMGTAGNTFHITGVQLEVGDKATPFEHRSYGEELSLCQRYYEAFSGLAIFTKGRESDRLRYVMNYYKVNKRTTPTVSISGTADGSSFSTNTDSSVAAFRTQCTGSDDGSTPYYTSATIDAEL